jgi:hypothetical protein
MGRNAMRHALQSEKDKPSSLGKLHKQLETIEKLPSGPEQFDEKVPIYCRVREKHTSRPKGLVD